jgi:hypothetical protein
MSRGIAATMLVVLAASEAFPGSGDSLDQWIGANTPPGEPIICKLDADGEYFFVARAGANRLRLGSRLDMTEYRDTHSFATIWMLKNERGDFVTAKVTPTVMKSEYVTSGDKTYAESVEYQSVLLGTEELRVEVAVEKCPALDCEAANTRTAAKKYGFELCTTRL